MAESATRRVGANTILVSAVIASLPVAGCVTTAPADPQRAAYSAACEAKSPEKASAFIRNYPDSPMVRDLLLCLPTPALKRLAPDAVKAISPEVIKTLSKTTLTVLSLTPPTVVPRARPLEGGYDG